MVCLSQFKIVGIAAAVAVAVMSGPAAADVVVGVSTPLTGPNAAYGQWYKDGVTQAVADLNAKGGVLGQAVQADIQDDVCDPKQAASVANRFVDQEVAVVIGPCCSGSIMAVAHTYADGTLLAITPSGTLPAITEQGLSNMFRTIANDAQQGRAAGEYVIAHFKNARIAFIHDKQSYGKGLADNTKAVVNAAGLKEVMYEGINPGERDYSALITRLKHNQIDLVYYGGYYQEAGLITRQMREQGLTAQFMSGESAMAPGYTSITGASGEASLFTSLPNFASRQSAQALLEKFHRQGVTPGPFSWTAYAAVQVWAQAAEKAHSLVLKDMLPVLHSATFKTVIGDFGYDAKGDMTGGGYAFYKLKHGVFTELHGS